MNNEQEREILSEEERETMRVRLSLFMRANPARAPLSLHLIDSWLAALSALALPMRAPQLRYALAGIGILFIAGAGTSYAAQGSLPGELLYPVKVDVTEPIQGAFAATPQAKASFSANLTAARLTEAETLAAQGKLTPQAESTIESGLDQATEGFDASIAVLSNSSSSTPVVTGLESTMQATLDANGQVLEQLAQALPQTNVAIAPLVARIETRALALGNARKAATSLAVSASTTTGVEAAAVAQETNAEGELSAARTLVASISASSSGGAASETFDAEQEIGAGDVRLKSGQYGAALQTFQTASLDAQEAQLHVGIADQLKHSTGISLSTPTSTLSQSASSTASSASSSASVATSTATSTSTAATSSAPDKPHGNGLGI